MKIHFVNDQKRSTERPKLGLGYLSSYLKKYCADIEISVSFQGDDTLRILRAIGPDIVGLTATTETFNDVIRMGKEIKETLELPLVLGGTHITILPQSLPLWIDAGVIGEGERTVLELIEAFRGKGSLRDEKIKGIIFWDGERLRQTEERELIDPLDEIPFPDWDMLGLSKEGPGHILTSRGCTFKCVFCASSAIWKRIRFFSPEYVVSEIKTIAERFGRKEILIYDDLFTANRSRIRRISELIFREGLDKVVRFECLSNVNHFNSGMASDLRKMNVHRISFGMESGSPSILEYLKKGTVTREKISRAVKAGVDNGLEVLGSFMVGCPGETEEDLMMTYNFIKELRPTEIGVNVSTPFPGTELWDYAVSQGHIKNEWDDRMYAMKTITPETIKDKRLLCAMDNDKFINIYKMLIDLDSMLIDRRVRVRTMKEIIMGRFGKGGFPDRRLKILDTGCEDGTLGAAIKARLNAEVVGLDPEADYLEDSMRRLDKVVRGGIAELLSTYEEGYFDCIIFHEAVPDNVSMKHYGSLLGKDGFLAGVFANRKHYSYLAYSFYGLKRPFFETTDGTVQYMRWGIPEKEKFPGHCLKDVEAFLEEEGYGLSSLNELRGLDSNFVQQLSKHAGAHLAGSDAFSDEAVIRYFYTAAKMSPTPDSDGTAGITGAPAEEMRDICAGDDHRGRKTGDIEDIVPAEARRILDVGCGAGMLGRRLLARGAEEVVGVESDRALCEEARLNLTRVICGDIEEIELPFERKYFDCIVLADVLEHLKDPLPALKRVTEYLSDGGTVIARIPNVRYLGIINMLVEGRWMHEGPGIAGKAPLRFFSRENMEALFEEAALELTGMSAASVHPKYYELDGSAPESISFGRVLLKGLNPGEVKDLFVEKYMMRANKKGSEFRRLKQLVDSSINSGNLKEVEKMLEEYLDLHLADMDALYAHAEVCYKLGLFEKAGNSLERILIFEPQRQDACELMRLIRQAAL